MAYTLLILAFSLKGEKENSISQLFSALSAPYQRI